MTWIVIGAGGAIGAVARHGLNTLVHGSLPTTSFPAGILLINVLGCGGIGLLAGLLASSRLELSPEVRAFVFVGVLGGFTTFSSFSLDTLTLVRGGHGMLAAWNVVSQVGLSLLAVGAGYRVGTLL
jgi:fluoride exporter